MHWHTAGLGPYASMRFPEWAYSHRRCASSGRTRSRSCWLRRLAHPDLVFRTHFSRDSTSLAYSSEKGPPLSGARHHMAPASRSLEPPCVAPGWDVADLSGLPPAVVETITQARAPSTRQTYALKRSLFANWCSSHREDPQRCTIGVVLSFLQERLECRLSPSTLKCMWPLSRPTTMQWTAGPWDSMISSWGSWRVPGGWTMLTSIKRSGTSKRRSSLSVAVTRKSIVHIRGPHPELQKLWAALFLPRRSAEREDCLQTEVGPLDSGGRHLGVPIARRVCVCLIKKYTFKT